MLWKKPYKLNGNKLVSYKKKNNIIQIQWNNILTMVIGLDKNFYQECIIMNIGKKNK